MTRRWVGTLLGPTVVILIGLVAVACRTGDGLEADAVELEGPGFERSLTIVGCGFDERGVFVLAAEDASTRVQLLLRVDGDDVDEAGSGITVELDSGGVLGAGDPELIGSATGSAGTIESAALVGDRVDVRAAAEPIGTTAADGGQIRLRARCSVEDDDEASGRTDRDPSAPSSLARR